jgi:HD-like signal output (HDOD) protein
MLGIFTKRSADPRAELKAMLGDYELPSFRTTVMETLRLLRDENATAHDIAVQIELDPGIQMKVLRAVNAAAFGLPTKVSSILHAINLLGRSRLEPLVLTAAVKDSLPPGHAAGFDGASFWQHSALRAMAARGFAKALHAGTQEEAFAAGLLLDMAVPVLVASKGPTYVEAYLPDESASGLVGREEAILGYNHTTVGRLIAEAWEPPDYLCDAIELHHDLDAEGAEAGIRLAGLIRDQDRPEGMDHVVATAESLFGLSGENAAEIMAQALKDASHFASLIA